MSKKKIVGIIVACIIGIFVVLAIAIPSQPTSPPSSTPPPTEESTPTPTSPLTTTETISTPSTPTGPSTGNVNEALTYITGASTSSLGHGVQCRFNWGDGSYSEWSSSTSATHSWSSPSNYMLQAQGRSSANPNITSSWSGSRSVTINPTPAKVPEEDVKSLSPDDVIPLALPGFKLIEKKTHVLPLFGGPAMQGRVEYYAYTLFQPEANSKFEGKVKSLKVLVYLFKDIESCNEYLSTRTGDLPEIQVNNGKAVLVDNEFTGADGQYYEVFAYQQYGKLLIISRTNSTPSRHLFGPYPCTWDKQAVKEAAIQGLENIR